MSQTLLAINEKIKKQIKEENTAIFTKKTLKNVGFISIFSILSFSMNYKMGAIFMLPILCSIILYKKRQAYYIMGVISILSIIINYKLAVGIIATFIPLSILIHRDNKKNLNLIILSLIALMSYCINSLMGFIHLNLLFGVFIAFYNTIFFTIYFKAIEINNYNNQKKNFLFKEEIIAILAVLLTITFSLFTVEIFNLNVGYMFLLLSIMILGVLTNKIYALSYSFACYLILQYVPIGVYGVEVIPIVGILSTIIPFQHLYLKTTIFYLVSPVLLYFNLLNTEIMNTLFSIWISASLFYFISYKLSEKHVNMLQPKYEDSKYYQLYVERFREDISQRLLNFAELFDAFANKTQETNNELFKIDEAIDEIIDKHCKNCLKKELCLNSNHIKTYNYFSQLLKEGDAVLSADKKRFLDLFGMFCLNSFDIINTAIELNQEYLLHNPKEKNSNILFQSQLHGLAGILQNFAIEVNTDYENETIKIEKVRDKMVKLGINIAYLKINNSKKKNLDIDFGVRDYVDEYDYLISNLISDVFREDVELMTIKKGKSLNKIKIISKQQFDLEFGTSYIGKDGKRISGDNFLKCDMHNGNTVIALSDGMGNGYSAHIESKSTLELLNKILQTGADDYTAVSIINTLVSLKEYNERFSTLDYITINKSLGTIDFYKIGSAPSFIIRGNKVIRINNDNLPVGVTVDIDKISFDIQVNDIIVIVSDGVVERFNNINKFEKLLIDLMKTTSIQIAHDIIRAAITEFGGKIIDDMTAIVIKVNHSKVKASA